MTGAIVPARDRATTATGPTRTIGSMGLAASIINVIIGSSIFVFPAIVAAPTYWLRSNRDTTRADVL